MWEPAVFADTVEWWRTWGGADGWGWICRVELGRWKMRAAVRQSESICVNSGWRGGGECNVNKPWHDLIYIYSAEVSNMQFVWMQIEVFLLFSSLLSCFSYVLRRRPIFTLYCFRRDASKYSANGAQHAEILYILENIIFIINKASISFFSNSLTALFDRFVTKKLLFEIQNELQESLQSKHSAMEVCTSYSFNYFVKTRVFTAHSAAL